MEQKNHENSFLRQNIHADRDPEVTLKFKDGGKKYYEELGDKELESPITKNFYEEEKESNEIQDVLQVIIKQYNNGKVSLTPTSPSPLSFQLSVKVPEYFSMADKQASSITSVMGIS